MLKKLALAGALCCALASPAMAQSLGPLFSNVQTATLSAAPLPSQKTGNGIVLKADYANTGIIYVGPAGVTTTTGYPLKAGEAISYGALNGTGNISLIYMIGTNTTDILHFTGN